MRNLYNLIVAAALALPLCTSIALAQNKEVGPNPNATRTQLAPIARLGVVDMREETENWDPFMKTVQKIHIPGIDARKDRVAELKEEANMVHEALIAAGVPSSSAQKTSVFTAPTLGTNFFGNAYGGGDPADNAIAVSEAGLMISGSNTRFSTYDASGTQTSSKNFTAFASAGGVSTSFTFDPKCTYDPVADRFVVAFLNGSTPTSTKVIVAFSQTNDPAGAWNVYAINGNVNNLGVWTDFVQIGLNTNEIFLTGNPFTTAGSSQGAAIWQINKADGYSGAAITPVLHYTNGGFSLHPVQGGATLYGPNMYFLESDLGSSSSINLHQITNSIANNGVLNSAIGFTLGTSYSVPPTADQRGTTINLKTNDTRVQNSYYENSRIEFVLNSNVNGMAGVYHGTGVISPFLLSFSSFTGQLLGYSDLDIAYPSIAYAGQQDLSGFNQSYISFNTSGPNNFPGLAAVYADENGYSPKVVIKEGVNFINSADNRWGDYAGLEERKNHPGEVWAVGTMGNTLQQQRTYIGQLLPPVPVGVTPVVDNGVKMEVFPNPATEIVKFEFPVVEAGEYKVLVSDLQGRLVKLVVQNWLAEGKAMLSFNAQYLASGTYIVSVENDSKKLFTEKLVVSH
jgi:Secretion system C-terminal sorting domain